MKSGAAKPICVIIPRHPNDVCFGFSHLFPVAVAAAAPRRRSADRRKSSRCCYGMLMERSAGSSLVCEAVVCQHSALASVPECVCVCVFSLPTRLSEHSILQLNYVKIHFDITATHFSWKMSPGLLQAEEQPKFLRDQKRKTKKKKHEKPESLTVQRSYRV